MQINNLILDIVLNLIVVPSFYFQVLTGVKVLLFLEYEMPNLYILTINKKDILGLGEGTA